jgi:hypothetical protein
MVHRLVFFILVIFSICKHCSILLNRGINKVLYRFNREVTVLVTYIKIRSLTFFRS